LPLNATLAGGVGTFVATLKTAGTQTLTATDNVASSLNGTTGNITVSATTPNHFTFGTPATATAGSGFSYSIIALDPFNNFSSGYAGTVHFSSSDSTATLPVNSTLTNGVGTFSATMRISGSQTLT